MKKNEPVLELVDMYFSHFAFENKRDMETSAINTFYNIRHEMGADGIQTTTIGTILQTENEGFNLLIETVGKFKLDEKNISKETVLEIRNKNTLAIMFPYIRSQVTLLTAQPGMMPIILSMVDVNNLVDQMEEEDKIH